MFPNDETKNLTEEEEEETLLLEENIVRSNPTPCFSTRQHLFDVVQLFCFVVELKDRHIERPKKTKRNVKESF